MSTLKSFGVAFRLKGLPKEESAAVNGRLMLNEDELIESDGEGVLRLLLITNNSGCGTCPNK